MAISTFCTTLCAAMTMLAAVPAPALAIVPDTGATTAATATMGGNEAGRHHAPPQQFNGRVLFETDTPIGMAGTAPGEAPTSLLNQTSAYFGVLINGEPTFRAHNLDASEPEPSNLPLLGAAAIALLVAQLRRSQRPAVR